MLINYYVQSQGVGSLSFCVYKGWNSAFEFADHVEIYDNTGNQTFGKSSAARGQGMGRHTEAEVM